MEKAGQKISSTRIRGAPLAIVGAVLLAGCWSGAGASSAPDAGTPDDAIRDPATPDDAIREPATANPVLLAAQGVAADPSCVADVPRRFRDLPDWLEPDRYLGAHNDEVIPWPRYTSSTQNLFGVGEHFQGIQRFGRHLLVTGGVKNGPHMSQLIVVEMGSRDATGPWNLPRYGHDHRDPADDDRVVAVVDIDAPRWHAGGFQISDAIAAVPLFGEGDGSEVRFFDVTDPVHPIALEPRIERATRIAYAVGLTRVDEGRYLAVVWDDEQLDFYRSRSDQVLDGFDPTPTTVLTDSVEGGFQQGECGLTGCGTYQNLNFVRDCDGRLFLIGTRNAQKTSPLVAGSDLASLYEVHERAGGESPGLSFVDRRAIDCSDEQCNFGAGAGVYVDDADHLILYGTFHWLHAGNQIYNFNEYSYP